MEAEINMFIEPILKKRHNHDFKAWRMKRKLIKIIRSTSPSFKMIWDIHEFLLLITNVYMYDNNKNFHLFLANIDKKLKNDAAVEAIAMIYKEEGFSIKFVLIYDRYNIECNGTEDDDKRRQINIEIQRNGQNKSDIERISFFDGRYKFKDIYDEEKMLFITSCLMNGVAELVEYFYKNKRL